MVIQFVFLNRDKLQKTDEKSVAEGDAARQPGNKTNKKLEKKTSTPKKFKQKPKVKGDSKTENECEKEEGQVSSEENEFMQDSEELE